VRDPVAAAQALLDAHPSGVDGQCLGCGAHRCAQRRAALRALGSYGLLPRRRPGLTRPALLGDGRGGFGWFAGPAGVTADQRQNRDDSR
jgi:hypothetical protein